MFDKLCKQIEEKINMGITYKPVGKMKSIMIKLKNTLLQEIQFQKEKKKRKQR